MKEKNLFQRLNAVMSEITGLEKDLNVGTGSSSYKAIGEAQVMNKVRPLFVKHGIVVLIKDVEESSEFIEYTNNYGKPANKRDTVAKVKFEFVNIDDPTDRFETVSVGYGTDSQDKGIGKAITYAHKYMIMKNLLMTTGDDTDNNHSDDYSGNKKENKKTGKKETWKIELWNKADSELKNKITKLKSEGLKEESLKTLYSSMEFEDFKNVIMLSKSVQEVDNV